MARSRNIKPGFFVNEHLAVLPFETRLLFIGLWTLADREGRLEDRPTKIKMNLFPLDSVDVDKCLDQLAAAGEPFIERYSVDGLALIQIGNFEKHQSPHHKEPGSILPLKPEGDTDLARDKPRASPGLDRDLSNQESAIRNQVKGISNQESAIRRQEAGTTPEEVFDYFRGSNAATKPTQLTPSRRKKLATRLKDPDWPWKAAIDRLPIPNDERFRWQPDLNWLIDNDTNAVRLAEGTYDRASGPAGRTEDNLAAVEAFANG